MFQNIKTDIVYYKTNTDFELEFNLCGCCRMRLLNDKATDKKALVHALARAVSRSRVIIITGGLFGEEGIIEITARAVSKTVTEIENGKYGIKSGEKISIINGATPLVTPDGIFGGCIIESGPQSMILLTDNKAVRKTVMTTLIHPYVEELYAIELKAKANSAASDLSAAAPIHAVTPPAPSTFEETDIIPTPDYETVMPENTEQAQESEEAAQEAETKEVNPPTPEENPTDKETKAEFEKQSKNPENEGDSSPAQPLSSFFSESEDAAVSGGMTFTENGGTADEMPDVFIEPQNLRRNRKKYRPQPYVSESDDSIIFRGDEDYPKRNGFISSDNLPILILSILLLIILAVLCYCIFYVPAKDGVSAAAYLQETFSTLFG